MKIGTSPELIKEGIRKAKVAYLLDTKILNPHQNYLNTLLRFPIKSSHGMVTFVDGSRGISWETQF